MILVGIIIWTLVGATIAYALARQVTARKSLHRSLSSLVQSMERVQDELAVLTEALEAVDNAKTLLTLDWAEPTTRNCAWELGFSRHSIKVAYRQVWTTSPTWLWLGSIDDRSMPEREHDSALNRYSLAS